ncbi:MAG: iron-containing alcohol dehydrogenase [Firmicutes bacterium]|nr:iron-containing alcohol dehydrogenase [Bacillota bacterium]
MNLFNVKASVHLFDKFSEFAESFSLSHTDLILTETFLYDRFVKPLNLPCKVILKDRYSTAEPNEETVDSILQDMADMELKRVIAVGGGSVIDIAKVICVKDAYPIQKVMSHETPPIHDKELIVLPTTCGTGSEVTYGGIITMTETGLKTAIMDDTLVSRHAVLIPELMEGLPYKIFVHTSVDALAHSMEAYVSATRGNEFARAVGARCIKLVLDGYAEMALHGEAAKPALLKNFIQASCLGGMAVNNGGAGPVHALAYPLGEVYHMSHGESIYEFLTDVFCHYEKTKGGPLLEELGNLLRPALDRAGIEYSSPFEGLGKLLEKVCPLRPLSACGMTEEDVIPFTDNVFAAKQRLLAASYSELTREDAIIIYQHRLNG